MLSVMEKFATAPDLLGSSLKDEKFNFTTHRTGDDRAERKGLMVGIDKQREELQWSLSCTPWAMPWWTSLLLVSVVEKAAYDKVLILQSRPMVRILAVASESSVSSLLCHHSADFLCKFFLIRSDLIQCCFK